MTGRKFPPARVMVWTPPVVNTSMNTSDFEFQMWTNANSTTAAASTLVSTLWAATSAAARTASSSATTSTRASTALLVSAQHAHNMHVLKDGKPIYYLLHILHIWAPNNQLGEEIYIRDLKIGKK